VISTTQRRSGVRDNGICRRSAHLAASSPRRDYHLLLGTEGGSDLHLEVHLRTPHHSAGRLQRRNPMAAARGARLCTGSPCRGRACREPSARHWSCTGGISRSAQPGGCRWHHDPSSEAGIVGAPL